MATVQDIEYTPISTLSADAVQALSDRLFARGISSLSTYSPREKADLILASRALRELLRVYERGTGRTLHALLLNGGC